MKINFLCFIMFIKHKKLFSYIKMDKEISTSGNIEIEKNKVYRHKTYIFGEMQIFKKYQYLTRFHLVKKAISTLQLLV